MSTPPEATDAGAWERTGAAEQVRLTFEQIPIALVGLWGPEHTMIAANAAYRALLGHQDLIGLRSRDAFPEAVGQRIFELMDRVYETGEPAAASGWRYQLDLDGSGVTTDIYLDFSGGPLRDAAGQVVGTYFSVADATDRVRAEQVRDQEAAEARQRYAEARGEITRLQGALLPADLPLVPGLDIAASYLLAADDTAAGGDWFDAVVRPDGCVAVVVGDVVGHGVAASAVMGQLRAVLHERLLSGVPLTAALGATDHFARSVPAAHVATVCVVEIDPAGGEVAYCTAGHLPPLVVSARTGTRYLPPSGARPLATDATFTVSRTTLEPDDVLLLYTDGILERPGVASDRASVELSQVVTDAAENRGLVRGASARATERVCQLSLELLTRESGYADDITLLAVQRIPLITPLDLRLPARPGSVPTVRIELAEWLEAMGVRPADELAVQHAVVELVTNAVVHAYQDGVDPAGDGGTMRVHVDLDAAGRLIGTVTDDGRWRPVDRVQGDVEPRAGGRGLSMSAALVDELDVSAGSGGTTVTVTHRLTRSAEILSGRPSSVDAGPVGASMPYEAVTTQAGLEVGGPVDLLTAGSLRNAVLQRSAGHSQPLIIDLSGVTHLASVGVQVLYEAHNAGSVELRADPGSPAQQVLELVRLPYRRSQD